MFFTKHILIAEKSFYAKKENHKGKNFYTGSVCVTKKICKNF